MIPFPQCPCTVIAESEREGYAFAKSDVDNQLWFVSPFKETGPAPPGAIERLFEADTSLQLLEQPRFMQSFEKLMVNLRRRSDARWLSEALDDTLGEQFEKATLSRLIEGVERFFVEDPSRRELLEQSLSEIVSKHSWEASMRLLSWIERERHPNLAEAFLKALPRLLTNLDLDPAPLPIDLSGLFGTQTRAQEAIPKKLNEGFLNDVNKILMERQLQRKKDVVLPEFYHAPAAGPPERPTMDVYEMASAQRAARSRFLPIALSAVFFVAVAGILAAVLLPGIIGPRIEGKPLLRIVEPADGSAINCDFVSADEGCVITVSGRLEGKELGVSKKMYLLVSSSKAFDAKRIWRVVGQPKLDAQTGRWEARKIPLGATEDPKRSRVLMIIATDRKLEVGKTYDALPSESITSDKVSVTVRILSPR